MWGDPADVGKVVAGATFDVVLDNNGKDLDTVRFVTINSKQTDPSIYATFLPHVSVYIPVTILID